MSSTGTTPADWYPDPSAMHQLRYWNGSDWTEHVADNGVTAIDPLPAAPVAPSQFSPQPAQGQPAWQGDPGRTAQVSPGARVAETTASVATWQQQQKQQQQPVPP